MAIGVTRTLGNFNANQFQPFVISSSISNIFLANVMDDGTIIEVDLQLELTTGANVYLVHNLKIYPGTTQVVFEDTEFKIANTKMRVRTNVDDGLGVIYTAA